jgi:hypothetical protein
MQLYKKVIIISKLRKFRIKPTSCYKSMQTEGEMCIANEGENYQYYCTVTHRILKAMFTVGELKTTIFILLRVASVPPPLPFLSPQKMCREKKTNKCRNSPRPGDAKQERAGYVYIKFTSVQGENYRTQVVDPLHGGKRILKQSFVLRNSALFFA